MKRKRPIGLIILILIFILGSFFVVTIFILNWADVFSDFSDLQGDIISNQRSLHVSDKIKLELTVPERFEMVNRLRWEVDPPYAGRIEYDVVEYEDGEIIDKKRVEYPKWDRIAYFTANQPGRCAVYVSGYYKKSNRELITKLELAVTP